MDIKKLYQNYSLNTYTRVGPVFIKGKGSFLWDDKGKKYLDLFPGWGVSILGHCYSRIVKVIVSQAEKLIHLPNNLYQEEQALLAQKIVKNSYPAKVFFANSGAEGIEGAIKLSRLYGKGERFEIITMKNSFHGRTFGALSATGQKKHKESFVPILGGFKEVDFNNISDFKKKVNKKTVAVLLELIQGEGGVNVADKHYAKDLENYCKKNGLLFIVDEVQTGMARTGKLFCYENYGVIPDIMVLSKGLGAGFPISAIVVKEKLSGIINPGMHASTFGGSPLASRVSREVFSIIEEEKVLNNVNNAGKYLFQCLNNFRKKFPSIKEVRGKGLMLALELDIDSYPVFLKCLEEGLIVNATHKNVLRIMPSLNITKQELGKGLDILESVFYKIEKNLSRLLNSS